MASPHTPPALDLHSGRLYWLLRDGLGLVVPRLTSDVSCDVAVLGSGITGALTAESLAREGLDVVLLDRRDLGQGSTIASSALLQYDLDVPLHRLEKSIGNVRAVRGYRLGVEAIERLEATASRLAIPFERVASLHFCTSARRDAELRREFEARRRAGFDVDWVGARELRSKWGLVARGAIRSNDAAQIDPYQYCHALLASARERGARVYDRTEVASLREGRDRAILRLRGGAVVEARHVVCATGYETGAFLPRGLVRLSSTYVLVSEPTALPWHCAGTATTMWELADPYVYVRAVEGRLMIGGADEEFVDDRRRDRLIPRKTQHLLRRARLLFPSCRLEPAFAWTGTFATTADGLGFVGSRRHASRVLFALGFGGNGITGGAMACTVLTDLIMGRPNGDAAMLSFDRRA